MRPRSWNLMLPLAFAVACGSSPSSFGGGANANGNSSSADGGGAGSSSDGDGGGANGVPGAIFIPPETQRMGDPAKGYDALVNGGYISLGIPWSGFSATMTPLQPADTIPGRTGHNADVGYTWNVSTNPDGIEIVSSNCLTCHASPLPLSGGKLFVGLGGPAHAPAIPSGSAINPTLITAYLQSSAELLEFQEYGAHLAASQEAGELLAFGAQAAHRDPSTLAWLSVASFDASTGLNGWVDVPPWWRTKKKNGLYANGMGRGDHVHHMMNMSVFSVHNVAEAKTIDAMFVDIAAYLPSIVPPKFPLSIDTSLASQGEAVFLNACASCHGVYGDNASYPNLLIPVDIVGTDPDLATKGWANPASVSWFAASFYGTGGSRLDPEQGYVAPPLDGIWATAPFFHNGSVPTLEGVLDSSKRPASWSMSFTDADYDSNAVGWNPSSGPTYDTTQPGYSNAGHTYGDALSDADRHAVLEYLKTL